MGQIVIQIRILTSGNSSADLLRTRSDSEESLGLDAVIKSIAGDGGSTGHVFVGRVGTGTNQTDLELLWPVVGLDSLAELRDWGGKIWGEWTVDVWLKLGEVDLNEFVVFSALIFSELLGVYTGEVTNILTLGSSKVLVHAVVEWEERGSGTNLGTHVTDGTHTGGGDLINTWTVVLDNGTGSTLDSEDTSNLKNDI